ncbi:MAG: SH3 domain-containing protein [Candidatus Gracilibacteria bacterium]
MANLEKLPKKGKDPEHSDSHEDPIVRDWFIKDGQTSTKSAVEAAIHPRVQVTAAGLNFREMPSANGNQPLGKLKKGNQVVVLEDQGNWLKIEHPRGPKFAPVYINKKYVALVAGEVSEEVAEVESLGLSVAEEDVMASYSKKLYQLHPDQNTRNRTWEHRLVDHELLIESLIQPETNDPQVSTAFERANDDLESNRPALRALHHKFFGARKSAISRALSGEFFSKKKNVIFFDLGPGTANVDLDMNGGDGRPAITSQEIAERFPQLEVVAVDLPSEVDIFTGKAKGISASGEFAIAPVERSIALSKPNFHILAGNGLLSLKSQAEDSSTNPYPERRRPQILPGTPIIVRVANSIDVYCSWNTANGDNPSIRDSLGTMAVDFKDNPLLLLFNKEILFKEKGSLEWHMIGEASPKGFYHNSRESSRRGRAPFKLDLKKIDAEGKKWETPSGKSPSLKKPRSHIIDQYGNRGIGERSRLVERGSSQPQDLITINGVTPQGKVYNLLLKREVADSFIENLKTPAEQEGIFLHINAGFRSFDGQEELFKRKPDSAEEPGFSEHQLGTAIDITGMTRESKGFLWLLKNGFKAGWIPSQYFSPVRTIKEPWHWRCVGPSAAKSFYKLWEKEIKEEIKLLEDLLSAGALRENPNKIKAPSLKDEQASTKSAVEEVLHPRFKVTASGLNFRAIPSADGNNSLGKLKKGDQVIVLEEKGNWLKIEHPRGPALAPVYVNKKYLAPVTSQVSEKVAEAEGLGLSPEEEATLRKYSDKKYELHPDQNIRNRTWEHRLVDHELLLDAIIRPGNPQVATEFARAKADLGKERLSLESLRRLFLGRGNRKVVFFDIGPGIGNVDLTIGEGKGKPAITSQEMAARFPEMAVIATDLPSEVDIFTGKAEGVSGDGTRFKVSAAERKAAMHRQNFHVMAGNGLASLKSQTEELSTNPFPDRTRPQILPNTPIVVRMANSVDIYCSWDEKNGGSPSVKESLAKMATDFKSNPLILLFNKEILFKKAGETQWSIIGRVSPKGFYHKGRGEDPSLGIEGRQGRPPFQLEAAKIEQPTTKPTLVEKSAEPIVDLERAKAIRQRDLPVLDVNGQKLKPRKITEGTRRAELTQIIRTRRSSAQQEDYLAKESVSEKNLQKELASQIPAMHPECRMSINLPAYRESLTIYKALYEYTVRQANPDGSRLNPDYFEINVMLNSPNSNVRLDDATREQIQKFQRDYPEYHVHLIEHTFSFEGKPVMGKVYKTLLDTAIYRNLQRPDGENKERLILRSGGGDAKEKSPLFLNSVMRNFEDPKVAVYKSESQLPQQVLDACPLYDISYRVQTGMNRLWTKAQSNLGIGSYSAEIYAAVGGFKKSLSVAEDKDIAARMAKKIRKMGETFESRKELHVNALDDPRRGIFGMFQGFPLSESYRDYGDAGKEKELRTVDWNKRVIEGQYPASMNLTAENLSREMSGFYRQYLNQVMDGSVSLKEFKQENPRATQEEIIDRGHEITQSLFIRLFNSMGIPRKSYTFIKKSDDNPAEIRFKDISSLEQTVAAKQLPSYQDFLIKLYSII